jgi:hypothetical protein
MSRVSTFVAVCIACLALAGLNCEENVYQVVDTAESPDDPAVIPRVVYTYPPANSTGPYPDIYIGTCGYYCSAEKRIQIRFNKYMDITSVRGAIRLECPDDNLRIDPQYVVPVGGDIFLITPVDSTGSRYSPPSFAIGDTCRLIVDTSARDIHGNRLAAPYSMTFVPEPYFRVRGVYPDPGDTVVNTYTQPRIRFNAAVDRDILSHVHLTPPDSGYWIISDDNLAVDFAGSYRTYGTGYSVTVDAGATDRDGRVIDGPYEFSFSTVSFVVTHSVPANGDSGVSLIDALNFHTTVFPDWSTLPGAFWISPATSGTFTSWSGPPLGAPIEFRPTQGFRGSTRYSVTIDTSLSAPNGQRLEQPYTISFVTRPFGLDSTSPAEGDSGHATSAWVRVYCNAPLEGTTVASSVSISPPSYLVFSVSEPTSMFMFHVAGLFQTKTTYTVTIDTTLTSKAGSRLPGKYTFSFTTQ